MASDYLHNQSVKPTNIFNHVSNPCSFSSNYWILIQSIWSNNSYSVNSCRWSIQFIQQTQDFQSNQTTAIIIMHSAITTFIIFILMHSFSNQRFMQKSVLNVSRSLTFKDHTLTELWLVITFTINLSNQLTFSTMFLIHVLSLLITGYLFKAYDLIIAIHSIHAIDQSNSFN